MTAAPTPRPPRRFIGTPRRARWAALTATAGVLLLAACADGSGGGEQTLPAGDAAVGRSIYLESGCSGCHGRDGGGGAGPSLVGIRGTERELLDGRVVVADQDYLVRAIMDPHADLVADYSLRMPVNTLTATEVDQVIAYIDELGGGG